MDFEQADAMRQQILADPDPMSRADRLTRLFQEHPDVYNALHMQPGPSGLTINNPGPDAELMAGKYLRNTQGAAQSYVEGMQRPRRDPKAAALRAAGKWKNRIQEAVQHGSWEKGIQRADYQEAVATATADGGQAYVQGVAKREPKIRRVFQELAPHFAGVSQAVQAMPQDTDAQRTARLVAAKDLMKQVGRRRRGIGTGGGAA